MQFPPPAIFHVESDDWGESVNPALARAEACEKAIREPIIDIKTICRFARRGIPEKLRPDYWKAMIGYLPPARGEWEAIRKAKAEEYMEIVKSVCSLNPADDSVACGGKDVHRVDVDIPRTMPSLHFFACEESAMVEGVPVVFSPTQQSLRRILHTLARVNKGYGYIQGMNELVGHLLFTFAEGKAAAVTREVEGDVFFCFQALLSILGDNFCRSLDFDREMGVTSTMRTFDRLFEFCDPELYDHVTNTLQVRPEFYAFRWLTLMLTQEFLVPDVLRIWDYLFSFGGQLSAALFYCAIAMLIHQREALLEMDNMGLALPFLQQFPPIDVGELIDLAQRLMDEYGIDQVRKARQDTVAASTLGGSGTASGGSVSSAGGPASIRRTASGSSVTSDDKASPTLTEIGNKLGGFMSAVKGWGKQFSDQHLFRTPGKQSVEPELPPS